MVKLAVKAGPSLGNLQTVAVNQDDKPMMLDSPNFKGKLAVRVKDFKDASGNVLHDTATNYFTKHPDLTWSIQIQGSFTEDQDLDDVVFGNTFDKPIRDMLPYGTALALKFVNFIDPALQQDVYADKPWAWSPLIATMNRFKVHTSSFSPAWSPDSPEEDVSPLLQAENATESDRLKGNAEARRKFFANEAHRKGNSFARNTVFDTEFCNGFIDFNTLALKLPIGNLQFGLAKYWDGQPVRYICQTRSGTVFFVVVFELVDTEGVDGVQKSQADFGGPTDETQQEDISNEVD